jgi:Carboxypeptidase regulatory-like domain
MAGHRSRAWRAAGIAALLVLAPRTSRGQRPAGERPGTVSGTVIDSSRAPAVGVTITLDSSGPRAVTDSAGGFRVRGVEPGRHTLHMRAMGYAPAEFPVDVASGGTTTAAFVISRVPVVLAPVRTSTVVTFGKPARLAGTMKYDLFYERRFYSMGGRFYTHEDLARMRTSSLIRMLERVPQLQLVDGGASSTLRFPMCANGGVTIEIDGNRVWPPTQGGNGGSVGTGPPGGPPPDPLEALRPLRLEDVEAVEVYPTSSSLPADLVGNACGAIVVWTR